MASIPGFWPWPRWDLAGFLRIRPKVVEAAISETVTRPELKKRRTYAPARDAFLENSAMRREMHRL